MLFWDYDSGVVFTVSLECGLVAYLVVVWVLISVDFVAFGVLRLRGLCYGFVFRVYFVVVCRGFAGNYVLVFAEGLV